VARSVWFDKAPDVAAVAAHLEALAATAKAPFLFEPVEVPAATDFSILHQAALVRTRQALAKSHSEADRILSQEVRAIDDLVKTANLLVERLREWYALHAPEAARMVDDAETLAKLVSELGDRTAVMKALDQVKEAEASLGTDLGEADLRVLRGFAATLAAVHESWHALEARVQDSMEEVAPNVASVVGPVVGARLIALSGGLERLATWPSGTVQLLGAETALFRHLKEGTLPPKHGILFQHPLVHQAPPWSRGAVARALALQASMAAKADAFTKNDLRPQLAERLKADLDRIAKRKMPARPPPSRFGGHGPPRPFRSSGPPGQGFRGPPQGGGRGPPRDGGRGAPYLDSRGPPRGPAREPWRGSSGGAARGPPRGPPEGRTWDRRDSGDRGAPPTSQGPGGPPPRPPFQGGGKPAWGSGFKPRRKPQGAFRKPNTAAKPPGKGGGQ
jgi:nucleolar protein 56